MVKPDLFWSRVGFAGAPVVVSLLKLAMPVSKPKPDKVALLQDEAYKHIVQVARNIDQSRFRAHFTGSVWGACILSGALPGYSHQGMHQRASGSHEAKKEIG